MFNIGSLFARHAIYRPRHTAIIFGEKRLTYFELNQSINRPANALLKLGIGKGDKKPSRESCAPFLGQIETVILKK